MHESEQTPLPEWRDLSPSEAALLAQTARLSPEERFNVLLSLWSFWHEVGGTARGRVSGVMRPGEHDEIDLGASQLESQPQHLMPELQVVEVEPAHTGRKCFPESIDKVL